MPESIKEILIRRDGMSEEEAKDLIKEACETLDKYLAEDNFFAAEEICGEFFGLEPDYMEEMLFLYRIHFVQGN